MSKLRRAIMTAAAGTAAASGSGSSGTYVEDVYSTYVYEGNGLGQTIDNGLDLGAAPIRFIHSKDSGEVDITVNAAAGETVVVLAKNSSSGATNTCTVNGVSVSSTHELSDVLTYKNNLFIETLVAGSNRIQVGTNNIGHTEIFIVDSNATISFVASQNWSNGSTQVTIPQVTTTGFSVVLLTDRDAGTNMYSGTSADSTYAHEQHSYFDFNAIGMSGNGSTVAARTIYSLTGTYGGSYFILKVEGVGTNCNLNTAATGTGGLTWIKKRNAADNHNLFDTERGPTKRLFTHLNNVQNTDVNSLTQFTSTGFTVDSTNEVNQENYTFASWSFLKKPGFLDIVTYTGNGTPGVPRTLSHNLGSVPGMIIVKSTSNAANWAVYHRGVDSSSPENYNLYLDVANARAVSDLFGSTAPTATEFTVGWDGDVNASGYEYVAYLFAHDDQRFGTNSDESIIKCGSYTGNGSDTGPIIDLGFEPQWIMIKDTTSAYDWHMFDTVRWWSVSNAKELKPNTTAAEGAVIGAYDYLKPLPTGFQITDAYSNMNTNNNNYIYMAIRRPHKPATDFAATDLFAVDQMVNGISTSGFLIDWLFYTNPATTENNFTGSRMQGDGRWLKLNGSDSEQTGAALDWDNMEFWDNSGGSTRYSWMWRRAPKFFDVVAYNGTGANRTITHNLNAVPELMIVKSRQNGFSWQVYSSDLGATKRLQLNLTSAELAHNDCWNTTDPTASVFSLGTQADVNGNGSTYIAYLFASVAGISKVGTYSGSGSTQTIDCGFSNGARFVIIKCTSSSSNWFMWDSERGITSGLDNYLILNSLAAQTTNSPVDVNPASSGFEVFGNDSDSNRSGETYLFYAIA